MLGSKQKLLMSARKKFVSDLRSIAILGTNNIRSELTKRGQEANVTYSIEKNKIDFFVEPKQDVIKTEDIPAKQRVMLLKNLGNVPLELLSQEMSGEFSTVGIQKAMERTQEQAGKRIQDALSKLI